MNYQNRVDQLKGDLMIFKALKSKPNFAALGREYGMDWRTVKKYYAGYEGKPKNRRKRSRLDKYRDEIIDKLKINRAKISAVYDFLIKKYGVKRIGTYANLRKYIRKNKLIPKNVTGGHPRYEKAPGEQAQVDWKEDITLVSKYGEVFNVNVLHVVLKYSRFSHLELSLHKSFDDVARGLINSFRHFGGVPKECLFDNMSTVANVNAKPKKPTDAISRMAKDFGFEVKLCGVRKPYTKGCVEAKNKIIDWIRMYNGEFETFEDLTAIIEEISTSMNTRLNQETQMSPTALYYKEKKYLLPLPSNNIIDTYLTPHKYKVSSEGLIRYKNSRYSVDKKLIDEEVTVDVFNNKLHIYYTGKLVACHVLSENPLNYKKEHYEELLKGKVKDADIESVAAQNLKMMDNLLNMRKSSITEDEAMLSSDGLIAYINQSEYGKWVINYYAALSAEEKTVFIKGMNEVLPYVANRDKFISSIKYSMKQDFCQKIALDCWLNDSMALSDEETILSQEGFRIIGEKYSKEITEFHQDMANHANENNQTEDNNVYLPLDLPLTEEEIAQLL